MECSLSVRVRHEVCQITQNPLQKGGQHIWTVANRVSSRPANPAVLKDVPQGFLAVPRQVFAACAVGTRLPTVIRVGSVNVSFILLTGVDLRLRLALRGREQPVGVLWPMKLKTVPNAGPLL